MESLKLHELEGKESMELDSKKLREKKYISAINNTFKEEMDNLMNNLHAEFIDFNFGLSLDEVRLVKKVFDFIKERGSL